VATKKPASRSAARRAPPRPARAEYKRTDERRAEILEATLAILARDGLEGWTTAALAARIGTSQAALFKHFADKDAILEAALELQADRMRAWMAAYRPAVARWDAVAGLVRHVLQFVEETGGGPLLAMASGHVPAAMRRKAQRSMRELRRQIEALYPEDASADAPEAPQRAADLAIAVIQSSVLRWLLGESDLRPREIAEPMLALLSRLLARHGGRPAAS
jgi:TetR/AcrR family transcriptional regulator